MYQVISIRFHSIFAGGVGSSRAQKMLVLGLQKAAEQQTAKHNSNKSPASDSKNLDEVSSESSYNPTMSSPCSLESNSPVNS